MLGVRDTYLSDMLNGRVPVTESITTKLYELIPDNPILENQESEPAFLQKSLQEKEKKIALLEEIATLLKKQVALLEDKIALLKEARSKKVERAATS